MSTVSTESTAALVVDVDATITRLADCNDWTLRAAVDDRVEALPGDGSYVIWISHGGKLRDLASNPVAEGLWYLIDCDGRLAAGDWVAGPCVVTGPLDHDGHPTPISGDVAFSVALIAAAARNARARQATTGADLEGDLWSP